MRRNPKNKLIALLAIGLMVLLCPAAQAQQNKFRYKADVGKVDSDGVYKISLNPKLIAKSMQNGFTDIRLIDQKGRYAAYSVVEGAQGKNIETFVTFSEVKQRNRADTATVYIADAGGYVAIDQLWLILKNTAVDRKANLSGSDDLQHWYAIKEDIELPEPYNGARTEYEQLLNFPRSGYKYYKIQINNGKKDPIRIVKAGIYVSSSNPTAVYKLKPISLSAKDNKQQTSYFVTFDDYYDIFAIEPTITSPKYYNRNFTVYDISHKSEQKIYEGQISSDSSSGLILCPAKTNHIRIEISNGDDKPLIIKEVVGWAMDRYAIAYLEKGHTYSLLVGDSTAKELSYDLTFLHSKPMSQFPVIRHSAVYKNPAFGPPVFIVKRDYTVLIWAAIAGVLVVLSLLTWRMVKEMGK